MSRVSIVEAFDPTVHELGIEQVSCDSSNAAGRVDAGDQHGTVGWFVGGLGAGVLLGLIGTGVMIGASAMSSPKPATIKAGLDDACCRDGYRSKAKNKSLLSSLFGGLAGTAVFLAVFLASTGDDY